MDSPDTSKRDFMKRAGYATPVILTLVAAPEFAKAGSVKPTDPKDKNPNKPGNGWGKGGKP